MISEFTSPILKKILYYQSRHERTAGISPAAVFNPVAATLQGSDFSGISKPSDNSRKRKTLIVTEETLFNIYAESACYYLQLRGFRVEVWQGNGKIEKITNLQEQKPQSFDPDTDYRILAEQHGLPREQVFVLQNNEMLDDFIHALKTEYAISEDYTRIQSHGFLTIQDVDDHTKQTWDLLCPANELQWVKAMLNVLLQDDIDHLDDREKRDQLKQILKKVLLEHESSVKTLLLNESFCKSLSGKQLSQIANNSSYLAHCILDLVERFGLQHFKDELSGFLLVDVIISDVEVGKRIMSRLADWRIYPTNYGWELIGKSFIGAWVLDNIDQWKSLLDKEQHRERFLLGAALSNAEMLSRIAANREWAMQFQEASLIRLVDFYSEYPEYELIYHQFKSNFNVTAASLEKILGAMAYYVAVFYKLPLDNCKQFFEIISTNSGTAETLVKISAIRPDIGLWLVNQSEQWKIQAEHWSKITVGDNFDFELANQILEKWKLELDKWFLIKIGSIYPELGSKILDYHILAESLPSPLTLSELGTSSYNLGKKMVDTWGFPRPDFFILQEMGTFHFELGKEILAHIEKIHADDYRNAEENWKYVVERIVRAHKTLATQTLVNKQLLDTHEKYYPTYFHIFTPHPELVISRKKYLYKLMQRFSFTLYEWKYYLNPLISYFPEFTSLLISNHSFSQGFVDYKEQPLQLAYNSMPVAKVCLQFASIYRLFSSIYDWMIFLETHPELRETLRGTRDPQGKIVFLEILSKDSTKIYEMIKGEKSIDLSEVLVIHILSEFEENEDCSDFLQALQALMACMPKLISVKRSNSLIIWMKNNERALHKEPQRGYLYACNYQDTLSSTNNNSYLFKPLFIIDGPAREDMNIQNALMKKLRMAVTSCFEVDWKNFYSVRFLGQPVLIENTFSTQNNYVTLTLVNPALLGKTSGYFIFSDYIFPVLSGQKLIACEGGTMFSDGLRWRLETSNIAACRVQISVPLETEENLINKNNVNEEKWDSLHGIFIIRDYFLYSYPLAQNEPCLKRSLELLRGSLSLYPEWLLAKNDVHAYLLYREKANFIKVDLGGIDIDQKEYETPAIQSSALPELKPEIPKATVLVEKAISSISTTAIPKPSPIKPKKLSHLGTPTRNAAFIKPQKSLVMSENSAKDDEAISKTPTVLMEALQSSRFIQMIHADVEQLTYGVLYQLKKLNIPSFYLSDFEKQADICNKRIKIDENGQPFLDEQGFLADFIDQASNHPTQLFTLVIGAELTPNARLNSLFEPVSSLQGKILPNNIVFVSLTAKATDDISFDSRHAAFRVTDKQMKTLSMSAQPLSSGAVYTVDLKGYPNWEQALFGAIVLENSLLVWKKSEFAEALLSGTLRKIRLDNVPREARKIVEKCIQIARAQGYWLYEGYKLPISENVTLTVNSKPFDFSSFRVEVEHNVIRGEYPSGARVINTQLFDYLLVEKYIINGHYCQKPGWIEAASGHDLDLYITTALSEHQWYTLFKEMQIHEVRPRLYLAPGVELPTGCHCLNAGAEESKENEHQKKQPYIILIEKASSYLLQYREAHPESLVFRIEDLSYQDIFFRIEYTKTPEFSNFRIVESDCLTALRTGQPVVLAGHFSQAMLNYLHPIFENGYIEVNGERVFIGDNLCFIIEHEGKLQEMMLALSGFSVIYDSVREKSLPPIQAYSIKEKQTDSLENESEAQAFIENRKALVKDILQSSPWLQLVGETGVGKSRLMESFSEEEDNVIVYTELYQLDAWANDTSEKIKMLIVDESNIENSHLTFLAPLSSGHGGTILYQGKIYYLDEYHKVAFLHNDENYGGGRVSQKLFEDYHIPSVELQNLPLDYVYHAILKPIYLKSGIKIPEEQFRADCQCCMEHAKSMSVRALKQWVLDYCAHQKTALKTLIHFFKKKKSADDEEADYIKMPSNMGVYNQLKQFLKKHRLQHLHLLPIEDGLNGFFLTGDSGFGKTKLVAAGLIASGFIAYQGKFQETDENIPRGFYYYKLDVSLPINWQKYYLTQAVERSYIVWIDELDAIMNSGLEKTLNLLMTGRHPETHELLECPGKIVATGNGPGYAGRAALSPACLARFKQVPMPIPATGDLIRLLQERYMLEEEKALEIAQTASQEFQKGAGFNLRHLFQLLDKKLSFQTEHEIIDVHMSTQYSTS